MTEEGNIEPLGTSTFRFSQEDRELILSQVATTPTFIPTGSSDTSDATQKLEGLKRKETTLSLHLSTLVEYIKVNRIPRGLRTTLTPNLLTDDSEFVKHWYGMCNQFSQDLMLLTVKHLQERLNTLKEDITRVEAELSSKHTAEQYAEILKNIDNIVSKLRENIVKTKTRKFDRDAKDYELNEVYTWQKKRRTQRRPPPPQTRPQASRGTPVETTSTDSEDSGSSGSRKRSFLQRQKKAPQDQATSRPQTRAWSGRGRGRGRGSTRR